MRLLLMILILTLSLWGEDDASKKGLYFDLGLGASLIQYEEDLNKGLFINSKVGYGITNHWTLYIDYPTFYSSTQTIQNGTQRDTEHNLWMTGAKYLFNSTSNTPYIATSIGMDFSKIDKTNYSNSFGESWSTELGYEFKHWYIATKYIYTTGHQYDYQNVSIVIGGLIYGAFDIY